MAISFVGSTGAQADNGADVTLDLTLISGLAQDDLVIVSYAFENAISNPTDQDMAMVTSGYTEIADLFSDPTQSFDQTQHGVFRKFMGASVDTSAVVDGKLGSEEPVVAVCMAFRGVDLTNPFDVTSTTAIGTGTFVANPPSIDWNTSGTWVVCSAASAATAGQGSYVAPSGYTTNAVTQVNNDASLGLTVGLGMGYKSSPSDPEDPGTWTLSGSDNSAYSWSAVTMALREVQTPPPPPSPIQRVGRGRTAGN